jgi:hypothetical protein
MECPPRILMAIAGGEGILMKIAAHVRDTASAFRRWPKLTRVLVALATALAGSLLAGTAEADPLIVGIRTAGFPMETYDFATGALVNSFTPTGASNQVTAGGSRSSATSFTTR